MRLKKPVEISEIENIFGDRKAGTEEFFKFFSILVPVVEKEGKLHLLYEVRAKHMDRQPGEICFPGGELEANETTKECALRETWEEIGIPEDKIKIVSQLDTIYTYSNFAMYCYLGIIEENALDNMQLNYDEVEEVFLAEIDELMENEPEVFHLNIIADPPEDFPYDKVNDGEPYHWIQGKSPVPVYHEIEDNVIWGLTARITKRFIDTIKKHR